MRILPSCIQSLWQSPTCTASLGHIFKDGWNSNCCCEAQYVLVRIFGTNDALFSRADEQRIFSQVAEVGLGPKLLVNPLEPQNMLAVCQASSYTLPVTQHAW